MILDKNHQGSVVKLIEKADHRSQRLLELLVCDFPCLRDSVEDSLHDVRICFHKRAQLFIADVWRSQRGQGIGHFEDIDSLTMFADYRVPQSLQFFGVFCYSRVRQGSCRHDAFSKEGMIRAFRSFFLL